MEEKGNPEWSALHLTQFLSWGLFPTWGSKQASLIKSKGDKLCIQSYDSEELYPKNKAMVYEVLPSF